MEGFTPIKNFEKTHLINRDTQEVYSLIKKRILKGTIQDGYKVYHLLNNNGKVKIKRLHRIMLETFSTNPNNLPIINHKDGNKLNNNLNNLEWCNYNYNNKEAYRLGLRKVSKKTIEQFKRDCLKPKNIEIAKENLRKSKKKAIENSRKANMKKICLYKENFYMEFESEKKASDYLKVHRGSVGRVAKNPKYKIKGYNAKYL